jgi:hypothetical protein
MGNITLTGILHRVNYDGKDAWQLEVLEASANAKVLEGRTVTVVEVPSVELDRKVYRDDGEFVTLEYGETVFPPLKDRHIRIEGVILPHVFSGYADARGITIHAVNTSPVPWAAPAAESGAEA